MPFITFPKLPVLNVSHDLCGQMGYREDGSKKKKKREMRRKKNFGKNEEEKIKYLQEKRLM